MGSVWGKLYHEYICFIATEHGHIHIILDAIRVCWSDYSLPIVCRLDALNIGWTDMTRGAVLYLVICLPTELTKLNLSGCRMSLLDEGRTFVCVLVSFCVTSHLWCLAEQGPLLGFVFIVICMKYCVNNNVRYFVYR